MKLPKNYFENLSAIKYRQYLKLLPSMQNENTRIITALIFTFFAMSFFGIFAINPTLSTIVSLRKQLADNELVYEKLKTKISNLSSLQQQYSLMQADLPRVLEAIPQNPKAPTLLGEVMGLANQKQIKILSLQTSSVILAGEDWATASADTQNAAPPEVAAPPNIQPGGETKKADYSSYSFSLTAQGSYDDLIDYAKTLTRIRRIIRVESMSINKDPKQTNLVLDIRGKAYFKR